MYWLSTRTAIFFPASGVSAIARSSPTRRLGVGAPRPRGSHRDGSHVEAERPQLLATLFRDLVRPPRGHPDPVDAEVRDEPVKRRARLVLDHVGERAGG